MGTAPGHPRSLRLTARPGQALPFTPRAMVLTLPSAGAARGLLCVCGLPAGGPGETGPEQGGICQGLKAARASAGSALQSTPSPAFPAANLALCAVPGSLGDQGPLCCGGPVPAPAEPASKVDSHRQKHKEAASSFQGERSNKLRVLPR